MNLVKNQNQLRRKTPKISGTNYPPTTTETIESDKEEVEKQEESSFEEEDETKRIYN